MLRGYLCRTEGFEKDRCAGYLLSDESEEICRFVQSFDAGELKEWFYGLVGEYEKWARFEVEWKKARITSIHKTEFPFSYRAGQRDMAAAVYRTILRKKKLFIPGFYRSREDNFYCFSVCQSTWRRNRRKDLLSDGKDDYADSGGTGVPDA